jgi:hypothetical protein
MTKFSGANQSLTFNSITFGSGGSCITSVEYSDDIDDFVAECAGATTKEHVPGLRNISATVSGYLNQADVALLNAIAPGIADTDWVHYPAGNTSTYIKITSSNATVLSRSISVPVSGITTFSFTAALDAMTIAAVTP